MTTRTLPWFETLTDSVYALGAAAREAQRAYRSALIACDQYALERLRPIDGAVTLTGEPSSTLPYRPHDHALFAIGDVLAGQRDRLRTLYSRTAHSYAYGTTWALLRVLDGDQPPHVAIQRTADGYDVIPHELCPIPPAMPRLERWVGHGRLESARQRMLRCDEAGDFADDLSDQPELSDHDAGLFHDALDVAGGLPDAAYAYGEQAENALHFALLEPRTQHRTQ
ncbi:hypothetical protein ACFV3R_06600 [Streptomyces sp. NPDC059740]|uniref:hypothetical protein n=1 Tax=Streptomyces sp. NPDC059740 TaxID=3346926 RepID=UPI0036552C2D